MAYAKRQHTRAIARELQDDDAHLAPVVKMTARAQRRPRRVRTRPPRLAAAA